MDKSNSEHIKPSPPHKKNNQKKQDSKTEVYSVFSGHRVVCSFRCSEELKKAFIPVAKHYFGSVCRPLEAFMASVLTAVDEHVNFGHTIKIEKLQILRNLRPRRYARGSEDYGRVELTIEDVGSSLKCFVCGEKPCFVGFNSDTDKATRTFACEKHFVKSSFEGWRKLW